MNIKVLPPDINESSIGFKIVDHEGSLNAKAIRFGLNAVKNVGKAAMVAILEARNEGNFVNFADFLSRVDSRKVNKKVLESLIKVGAMEAFGKRAVLLSNMDEIRGRVSKKNDKNGQDGLFNDEELKVVVKSEQLIEIEGLEEFSDEEIQNLERQLLGFSLSAKPVSELIQNIEHLATHKIQDVNSGGDSVFGNVKIAAVVSDVRTIVTKKSGQEMAFVKVKDDTGTISLVVFPKIYQTTRDYWVDNKPVLISGKIDQRDEEPSIIVDQISIGGEVGLNGEGDKFFIKIPIEAGENELKKLKDVLLTYPGKQKVTLIFNGSKYVELPIGVTWSKDLAHLISQIFSIAQNFD